MVVYAETYVKWCLLESIMVQKGLNYIWDPISALENSYAPSNFK